MKSILLLFFVATAQCKTHLADLVPICKLSDPNLNECAKVSTQKILPHLAKGVRDLHLIPMDPLHVPSLDFGQDTGPVSLSLKFTNATITGSSKAIVKSISLNPNGYKFEGLFLFPRFELTGNYVASGKILVLPINGKGFGNITATDMDVKVRFNCITVKKRSVDYLSIDKLVLNFKYTKTYIAFQSLFGGNKQLGEATNKFLNENTDEIVKEMRGTLEEVFGQLIKQLMNAVFENIPFDEAFTK